MKFYKISNPKDQEIAINLEQCWVILKGQLCTKEYTIQFDLTSGGATQIFATKKERDQAFEEIIDSKNLSKKLKQFLEGIENHEINGHKEMSSLYVISRLKYILESK